MPNVPHSGSNRLSVLVVDDNRDGADSTADLLTLYGYPARAVYTASAALAELAARPADAVVADIRLRESDGYSLAERLRGSAARPLLVAVTGLPNVRERCRAAGFDHVFLKPADPARLAEVLFAYAATRPTGP